MSLHRFFLNTTLDLPDLVSGPRAIPLAAETSRHMRVCRIEEGEHVVLVDETGAAFEVSFRAFEDSGITISSARRLHVETTYDVTLFQGISKGERMNLVMRACTELGLSAIIPVRTRRCVVRLDERKAHGRGDRWRKVVRSAAEQSSRQTLPDVPDPISFEDALRHAQDLDVLICPYEDAVSGSFEDALAGATHATRVGLFVGPEGGFATEEVDALRDLGAWIVSLGPTILRTETAGIVASALALYELGGLGRNP
jgi:16S rRNA (uracil1498-N3)-methyltransferase